jgi:hypothetical protein
MSNGTEKSSDVLTPEQNRDVVVEVSLTPHDVYTPFQWSRQNVARWVCAALLCYIFYDLFTRSSEALLSMPGGESILAVAALLALFVLLGLLLFPYLRVLASFRKSSIMREKRTWTFGSNGVQVRSERANSEFKWSLFESVFETRYLFLFMYAASSGMYLPKRCFRSPEDIRRLRLLIREHLPGKWRLRRE